MNKNFYVLIANSLLLATGVMLVLVSSIRFMNFWPIIVVFVDVLAFMFPTMCNGCNFDNDTEFYYTDEHSGGMTEGSIAWIILGILVTVGYAIPVELFRVNAISEVGVYLTIAGSTTILCAVLIFVRVLYYEKESGYAYFV